MYPLFDDVPCNCRKFIHKFRQEDCPYLRKFEYVLKEWNMLEYVASTVIKNSNRCENDTNANGDWAIPISFVSSRLVYFKIAGPYSFKIIGMNNNISNWKNLEFMEIYFVDNV